MTQAYQLFFVSDNLSDSGWEASDSHSPFLNSMQAFKHALMFATESDEVVDYSGWFEEDESVQHVAPTPCENSLQRPEAGTSKGYSPLKQTSVTILFIATLLAGITTESCSDPMNLNDLQNRFKTGCATSKKRNISKMRNILSVIILAFMVTGCMTSAPITSTQTRSEDAATSAASVPAQTSVLRRWSGYGITFEYVSKEEAFIDGQRADIIEREPGQRFTSQATRR